MSPPDTPAPETLAGAIRCAAARLAETSDTPRLDAELLAAHALGIAREALLLRDPATPLARSDAGETYESLVARRAAGEPVAYILGHRDFWTIRLGVGPGVLIPRPDSETLIEAATAHFAGTAGPRRILDLGTGSGALLLAALAEWPAATGVGLDRSPEAVAIACANVDALGMAARVDIREGDWRGTGEAFDLLLCNPPYVSSDAALPRDVADYEPHTALFSGADGLDDYRALAPLIADQLAPGGVACIEIGADQGAVVAALLEAERLVVQIRHDLAGRDRCIVARPR